MVFWVEEELVGSVLVWFYVGLGAKPFGDFGVVGPFLPEGFWFCGDGGFEF